MGVRIRGLLSARGEFTWAVLLLVVAPVSPLVIEFCQKWEIESTTLFLTAALFTVSQAFSVRRFSIMLLGIAFVALALTCYGMEVGSRAAASRSNDMAEQPTASAAVAEQPTERKSDKADIGTYAPNARPTMSNGFTDAMYFLSFAVMAFFGYVQGRFRYVLHMQQRESFFEFDGPEPPIGSQTGATP